MKYDMDAERAVFRERLGKRSDEGVERYLEIIYHGKSEDCEIGQMSMKKLWLKLWIESWILVIIYNPNLS
tara:strand:+ start:1760 stop:1969 length:210 start_codon:yes stop_codon:yes gene_type:complete